MPLWVDLDDPSADRARRVADEFGFDEESTAGAPGTRFQRAVRSRNLFLAETAALEMARLSLEDVEEAVGGAFGRGENEPGRNGFFEPLLPTNRVTRGGG